MTLDQPLRPHSTLGRSLGPPATAPGSCAPPARATLASRLPQTPDAASLGGRVVVIAYEVLLGLRTVQQLARWVSPGVLGEIHRRQQLLASSRGPEAPAARRRLAHQSVRLIRVVTCPVNPTVAEVSAVISIGCRSHAAAARVEYHRGRLRVGVLILG